MCHLNLIKSLDLTTGVKKIQETENYVITTETVSKTQTGGTNAMTWFLQYTPQKEICKKKIKETEKEPVGLNISALCRVDLSKS